MKVYTKKWTQFIPRPLDEIWDFFSRPENLNEVTPKEMNFEILTDIANQEMYEGMIISYKVTPVFGIRMRWTTEIQRIKKGEYFVDEQRFGPYAMWHHEHHFREADGGTYMTDLLHYAIPFGPIGRLANSIMVNNKIEEIFEFRVKAVERLFGTKEKNEMVRP